MDYRHAVFLSAMPVLALVPALNADSLTAKWRGDQIFVSAAGLDLVREPLFGRLLNGGTVAYDFHLALWVGNKATVRRRAFERFVVSYDLWEEKFAVTGLRNPKVAARNLGARAVGTWCLEHVALQVSDLKPADKLWVRLEVRAVDTRREPSLLEPDGVNVVNLVGLLSRPARPGEQRWSLESGQLLASEMRP
jgi:hypothetical protein